MQNFEIQFLGVDVVQKQQILMQQTQQFIKSVKGLTVTRLKQQIFFTNEHSLMTVGTMGRPYKAIYRIHCEIDTAVQALKMSMLISFEHFRQASIDVEGPVSKQSF